MASKSKSKTKSTETKNAVGRPSLLTKVMLKKAIDYLVFDFKNVEDVVPSVAGLAIYLGVNKTSLYEFANVDNDLGREFSNTLISVKEKQEKMLISGGLSSGYNATITKLMLTNHGYHDKTETDLKSSDGTMSPKTLNDFYGEPKSST